MATVTGLTAARMQEIIDKTLSGANIVSNHLILTLEDGSTIDAGSVVATTPPVVSSPAALAALETVDGREAYYTWTSGQRWHLRYDQGLDRWDYLGGPAMTNRTDADVTTPAGSAYTVLGAVNLTIPLNGNYEVHVGSEIEVPVISTAHAGFMNYHKQGAAMPGDDLDAARLQGQGAGNTGGIATVISPPGAKTYVAGDVIEPVYRDGSATNVVTFRKRWIRITPKNVST